MATFMFIANTMRQKLLCPLSLIQGPYSGVHHEVAPIYVQLFQ